MITRKQLNLECSGSLIKNFLLKQLKIKQKNNEVDVLVISLALQVLVFLENILGGKGVVKAGEEVARGGSKFNAVLSFN